MNNTFEIPTEIPLTDRQIELLGFLGRHESSLQSLASHFELSAREYVAFVTSPAVQSALRSMTETVRLTLEIGAMRAREGAMSHLRGVCDRVAAKPDGDKETRLAATTLGKLVHQALTPSRAAPLRRPAASASPLHSQSDDQLASGTPAIPPDQLEMLRLASGVSGAQSLSAAAGNAASLAPPDA